MKYNITIHTIDTVNEVADYWTPDDFLELLAKFNYPDADQLSKDTLGTYLLMAITDFEPPEAAAILLAYKLSEQLSEGQINQISHEMLEDKVSEEYPDIALHAPLFHINQLLYKAYNGKFPNTKATIIGFDLKPDMEADGADVTKELVLKAFEASLADSNIIKRLFVEQLSGAVEFPEAEQVIWELDALGNGQYRLLTSEYWIGKDDFSSREFEAEIMETVAE